MNTNKCSFGCVNVATGECSEGYIDTNGEMKFKSSLLSKIKNFFGLTKVPTESVYLRTHNILVDNYPDTVCVYAIRNKFTHEIYKLTAVHNGITLEFNVDEYLKNDNFVLVNFR